MVTVKTHHIPVKIPANWNHLPKIDDDHAPEPVTPDDSPLP